MTNRSLLIPRRVEVSGIWTCLQVTPSSRTRGARWAPRGPLERPRGVHMGLQAAPKVRAIGAAVGTAGIHSVASELRVSQPLGLLGAG